MLALLPPLPERTLEPVAAAAAAEDAMAAAATGPNTTAASTSGGQHFCPKHAQVRQSSSASPAS